MKITKGRRGTEHEGELKRTYDRERRLGDYKGPEQTPLLKFI